MEHEDLFLTAFSEARTEMIKEFSEEVSSMEAALGLFFDNVLECCNISQNELLKY